MSEDLTWNALPSFSPTESGTLRVARNFADVVNFKHHVPSCDDLHAITAGRITRISEDMLDEISRKGCTSRVM